MKALTFNSTQFDIVDCNGQPWLQARQIGSALGYAREDSINKIYERNADEFTNKMTSTVKLTLQGQQREVRIFSLRGAHLLAMFARTEVAKEFRRWVLDVLERAVQQQPQMSVAQQVRFDRRPLRGRHVRIALFDGQPWFAAGQLCSALDLGSSDRIVRSLPEAHKRKLQQGARELWLVDAVGARRAGDYCQRPVLDEFQPWLDRLLNEFAPEQAQLPLAGASREQMARGLLVAARFMCWFDPQGRMTLKELDSDVAVLKQSEFAGYIADPAGMPAAALPDILAAVSSRIKGLH